MTRRQEIDTNEKLTDQVRPTKERSTTNTHAVHCSVCDGLFYVGDHTYDKIERAQAFDPTDTPFVCDACEDNYTDEERRV